MPPTRADLPGPEAIHVWQAVLDAAGPSDVRLGSWLSADERVRADRFRSHADQRRFIVARSTLRAILGMYLGVSPAAVLFAYGAHGKPRLAQPLAEAGLRFNLSHADEVMLVAVTAAREVGVDLECVRPLPEADRIAERLFSPHERETLRALPASERLSAFFTHWTLKEAYLKALGDGLSRPLAAFEVAQPADGHRWLLTNDAGPRRSGAWWVCAFSPRPGYQAALAAEGGECQWRLDTWTWDEQPAPSRQAGAAAAAERDRT